MKKQNNMDNSRTHFFAVEYLYEDGRQTFEIFPNLEDAQNFIQDVSEYSTPMELWEGDFDNEMVYQEEDGSWNYEEFAGMVENRKTIKTLNDNPIQ